MFDIQANQYIVVNPLIEPQHFDSGQPHSWSSTNRGCPQLRDNHNYSNPVLLPQDR
jgi:hypothetical protein